MTVAQHENILQKCSELMTDNLNNDLEPRTQVSPVKLRLERKKRQQSQTFDNDKSFSNSSSLLMHHGIGNTCGDVDERAIGSVSAAISIYEDRHLQVTPLSVHTEKPATDKIDVAGNSLWVDVQNKPES